MKTKRWSYAHNGVLSVLAGIALVGCDPGQDGQEMGNQDLTSDTAAASLEYAPWVSKPSANSAKTTTVLPSANARFLGFLDLGGVAPPKTRWDAARSIVHGASLHRPTTPAAARFIPTVA